MEQSNGGQYILAGGSFVKQLAAYLRTITFHPISNCCSFWIPPFYIHTCKMSIVYRDENFRRKFYPQNLWTNRKIVFAAELTMTLRHPTGCCSAPQTPPACWRGRCCEPEAPRSACPCPRSSSPSSSPISSSGKRNYSMRETVKNHQISFYTSINNCERASTKTSDNFSVEALYLCGHLGQLVVTSKFNLIKLLNWTLPQNHSIYQMSKMLKMSLD